MIVGILSFYIDSFWIAHYVFLKMKVCGCFSFAKILFTLLFP
jgi:hypothetical protein